MRILGDSKTFMNRWINPIFDCFNFVMSLESQENFAPANEVIHIILLRQKIKISTWWVAHFSQITRLLCGNAVKMEFFSTHVAEQQSMICWILCHMHRFTFYQQNIFFKSINIYRSYHQKYGWVRVKWLLRHPIYYLSYVTQYKKSLIL